MNAIYIQNGETVSIIGKKHLNHIACNLRGKPVHKNVIVYRIRFCDGEEQGHVPADCLKII